MIVDDDPFQLEYLPELLRGLGVHDVSVAASGDEALAAMGKSKAAFDLMLVDLYMPGMDGFQFMESVAKRGFSGALIIVSGLSPEVLRSASLVAKLQRFNLLGSITKPVSKDSMVEMLGKLKAA
jgi:CheY-like chemotaxis protein